MLETMILSMMLGFVNLYWSVCVLLYHSIVGYVFNVVVGEFTDRTTWFRAQISLFNMESEKETASFYYEGKKTEDREQLNEKSKSIFA